MEQNSPHNPTHLSRADRESNQPRCPRKISEDLRSPTIVSPFNLEGEMLYRTACKWRILYHAQGEYDQRASMWKKTHVVQHREEINSINLHAFDDANSQGLSAAVYAVTHQTSSIWKGLEAAKSTIPKKGLTIPRLELVAEYMASFLARNVKEALQGFQITNIYCSTASTILSLLDQRGRRLQAVCQQSNVENTKQRLHLVLLRKTLLTGVAKVEK